MTEPGPDSGNSDELIETASRWLARQDRGLTPAEQDDYFQWLRQDPRHGQIVAKIRKTWAALDLLRRWSPVHSVQPNPDLLARPSRRVRAWRLAGIGLAAAAVVLLGIFPPRPSPPATPVSRGIHVIPQAEQITLADGSIVKLSHGGKIETEFSAGERRVHLLKGEAHFTVTKNPARPFVVDADGVSVRAIGTAFEVRRVSDAVAVLVTEGKVHVEQSTTHRSPTPLIAGEHVVVGTQEKSPLPVVTTLTPAEIDRALSWQGVRLEFAELPLSDVVREFNLRNSTQIRIAAHETAQLRIGGTFSANNVDGFVRLLQASFNLGVEWKADGSVLILPRSK